MATFDSTKTGLSKLLEQIVDGKIQLPDFQRGWVWDDDRIRSLLASESVSFPIGAVMPALAARTNRQIGGRAPSKYLPAIERTAEVGVERLDEMLRSHCIAPEYLRTDRFWEFYAARALTRMLQPLAAFLIQWVLVWLI